MSIVVAACPDRGASGNDPKVLKLVFHHQDPTYIDAYCQVATNLVDQH